VFRRLTAVVAAGLISGLFVAPPATAVPPDEAVGPEALLEGLQQMQSDTVPQRSLSVAPQVGWDAGLEGLSPPSAPWYRLWDMKVSWRDINPAPAVFDWTILDRRVAQVESWGGRPLLVLGLTPQWAAKDPSAGDPRWGAGSASPPANVDAWSAYVSAVANRYGGRIGAYEVWNEANLRTFWTGSAKEMAVLTKAARDAIKASVSGATVLAPSVTTRLSSGARFTTAFIEALGVEIREPSAVFDAWAIHSYPAGNAGVSFDGNCSADPLTGETPDDCISGRSTKAAAQQRVRDVRLWQQAVITAGGGPSPLTLLPIWDTEINYGLAGPGIIPGVDWTQDQAIDLIAYTILDSAALGIDNIFWYEFTAQPFDLLGVQMTPGSPVALAYEGQPPLQSGDVYVLPIIADGCTYLVKLTCPGANLKYANLNNSILTESVLTDADLYRANLYNSRIDDSVATNARFLEALLNFTVAERANFQGSDMRRIQATGANFKGAVLKGVNFRGAKLQGVNFRGADLRNADFTDADLTGANICGTQLAGAKFKRTKTKDLKCG
jgi:hypothetical protein